MNVVMIEPLGVSKEKINELAEKLVSCGHEFVYYDTRTEDTKELIERAANAEIVMLANLPFRREVIENCPKLKMISVAFTGVDHVDMDVCREKGITVCNAAGYSTNAVAELVYGLAISVIRNIVPCDNATRTEKTKNGLVGTELFNKKFGVVGTGAIGLRVAEIASAFGCEVLAYSRTQRTDAVEKGVKYVDLDTLLKESDIVSLHVPLNESTKNLIDEKKINLLKSSAILINTARGPVVDNTALAKALNEGKIAGAGIDVFENEPPIESVHPLVSAKNTVLTPHVAFATEEALYIRAQIVFDNIDKWLKGKPQNVICV
ncbi:glycerate dehydrogenase [Clostridium pasteurianum DSM 525 = ATCC 6013]|uniref:Glycerate dehydrogenase n=1 Tax=Clostridium pasteurianum DSM 525 = ATCC 6013 TaxID=1262449 RepID=A0A0H3J8V8_CLOPA|nr:2-hydroxyacid dehydrogenase [Clostridium pasteurianum]AJA49929.1 glycerate dehydrogenase [Clostridium pasteurianum DSM 525 = ATCC 6013]AJA53917.1 glycerate dehydrogenase [Clostridium pasteurianum DSM 525 = ATCC 6013]AOZ77065.1 hydroxyacid dehydrogenase [Clostridium pasteurianum DSM 525 = ATCC 6013]AOZ80862.1 hydroxyacid dehydrogenase [Clostridium pasteurianum]ELP59357.1 D-isomer specific 2-hydroxyacid dehydrogenase NAD-binding subunit [Clostridium pasteurianum DSM 525 = ATCC 6013]